MHLGYDDDFIEEAVRLCATGRCKGVSSFQIARFNREREKLYDILDPDERNAAFFRLHLEWFREWGLEVVLTKPLAEFSLLSNALKVLAFRKSRGKNDDGAELYVNEAGDRSGVVAMRPERLAREGQLGAFLRHEFTHLHDMVNPAFGYLPELPMSGSFMSQHHVARERYRLLWSISIDGRLTRERRDTIATRSQRQAELAEVFALWPEAQQQKVFEALWKDPVPTHQMLVDLACDPRQLLANAGPRPGAPCPLCGFPTFAWAEPNGFSNDIEHAIKAEFPDWTAPQGACVRCLTVFRARLPHSSHWSHLSHPACATP